MATPRKKAASPKAPQAAGKKALVVPAKARRSAVPSVKKKPEPALPVSQGVNPFGYIFWGMLFGYFLSKSRATDCNTVLDMFLFQDFQLYGVILVAVATVGLGLLGLRFSGRPTLSGAKLDWKKAVWDPQRLTGAFLLGVGWAIAGTCPGTSVVQLGEGKLVAFFTVFGIFLGVWAYERFASPSASDSEVS